MLEAKYRFHRSPGFQSRRSSLCLRSSIHELLRIDRQRRRKKAPLPPGVAAATPQEVIQVATSVTLEQATTFPNDEELFRPVDPDTILHVHENMAQQRETIKRKVGTNRLQDRQEDIIDLVGLLFEQMLDDESIPNAAKALLGHLHTPYIKIGLSDEDFFADAEHPARVFLDRAIAASAIWVDEIDLKEGVYPYLKEAVYKIIRLRQQSKEDFNRHIRELEEEVSKREAKLSLVEKRSLENERGKEQLLKAKEAAKQATADIFGGKLVPLYCKTFIDEIWVDYLTLLQLRGDGDTESENWKEALKLGRRILALALSREQGLGRAAQVETLSQQIHGQIGIMLPHQARRLEEFIEALYAYPVEETVPAFTEETGEGPEEEMAIDQTILDLYNKLRILPQDTWFEF
ncbi:MAG TPA: DUF1631 family protein, partial [Chromatiaceae bacterium]|nr:DUF1631 family protein [Chromatiaceae bacterium]